MNWKVVLAVGVVGGAVLARRRRTAPAVGAVEPWAQVTDPLTTRPVDA